MQWLGEIAILAHEGHEHVIEGGGLFGGTIVVPLIILGLGVLAVLAVLVYIVGKLRGDRRNWQDVASTLEISIAALPSSPPPAGGAVLEIYNLPMRLALLVIAPVGREGKFPPNEHLPLLVDAVAPNLMQVLTDHQPEFRRWPPQLSSQGFSQVFFKNVPLPGEGGKNTPWCGLAGRFDTPGGPFLAGLVCVAQKPNSIGQIAVAQPGQWLDILRVKV